MDPELDLFEPEELPADARELVESAERALAALRGRADEQAAAALAEAQRRCAEVMAEAEAQAAAAGLAAQREAAPALRQLFEGLRSLQESYARQGKLDEALAIRARVRQLRGDLMGVRPDPGILTAFTTADAGRALLFDVTGTTHGTVWGTDTYTADSRLATAAVHAGVLRDGERGLVRVTVLDGAGLEFDGSESNGVVSHPYGPYPLAYRVARAG